MNDQSDSKYPYVNIPLAPSITSELIVKLFNGQTIKRETIITNVIAYHKSRGGSDAETNLTGTFKKALSHLNKAGIAEHPSTGYWKIVDDNLELEVDENSDYDENLLEDIQEYKKISILEEYGTGKETLYMFYYQTYFNEARLSKSDRWSCKIGVTSSDVRGRILKQVGSGLPEYPTVPFIVKLDNSTKLERVIHNILFFRNQGVLNSPGDEWFRTNPQEILELIEWINPKIIDK